MHSVLVRLLAAGSSTNINIQPGQAGNLPGDQTLVALASGVGHWALLASIVGVIVGGSCGPLATFPTITNSLTAGGEASSSPGWRLC